MQSVDTTQVIAVRTEDAPIAGSPEPACGSVADREACSALKCEQDVLVVDQAWFGGEHGTRTTPNEFRKFEMQARPSICHSVAFGSTGLSLTFLLASLPHVLFAFETFSIGALMPYLASEYRYGSSVVSWVLQVEFVLVISLGTVCGKLCEKIGTTNYFLIGSWVYSVFTFITVFTSQDFGALMACRVLSSIGMGIMLPAANPLALFLSSKSMFLSVLGLITFATATMNVVSALATDILANASHWSYVFGVLSILSFCHSILSTVLLPTRGCMVVLRSNAYVKVDWIGAILLSTGVLCLVLGLSLLHLYRILIGLLTSAGGFLLITLFACYTRFWARVSLLCEEVMHNRQFYLNMAVSALLNAGACGERFCMPYIYKELYGQDTLRVFLYIAVPSMMLACVGPFLPLLQSHVTSRLLFQLWSSIHFVLLVALVSSLGHSLTVTVLLSCLTSLCYSGILTTAQAVGLLSAPHRYYAVVGSFNTVSINLGKVLGVALTVAMQVVYRDARCVGGLCDALSGGYAPLYASTVLRVSYQLGIGLCTAFLVAGHVAAHFLGVGRFERGRAGFRERLLAAHDTYDANRTNRNVMELCDDNRLSSL